jgi:hypothetical protein
MQPAMTKMYQLIRLIFGNATSREPIISGIRKLPSVVGIEGTRKNHTIIMPWMLNIRLYVSGSLSIPSGTIRSQRMIAAAMLPAKKKNVMAIA